MDLDHNLEPGIVNSMDLPDSKLKKESNNPSVKIKSEYDNPSERILRHTGGGGSLGSNKFTAI